MNTSKLYPLLILTGLMVQTGLTEEPGEQCQPGEIGRPGLTCQATDEWAYQPPYILNAKKGDVVLVSAANTIGGLLRNVEPPHKYCHAGIIVQNSPMKLRSATAWDAAARYADNQVVCDLVIADVPLGFAPDILKYGWPGTVTETLTEAYQGKWRKSPEGKDYFGQTFNKDPNYEYPKDGTIYPTVVKPPPDKEMADPTVRARLKQIADHSETIGGHYRWFSYTRADIFDDPARQCPPGIWCGSANREPLMCSSFIWRAAKAANVQVENVAKELPGDAEDRLHALLPSQRGLYRYTEAERKKAARWLHDHVRDEVLAKNSKASLFHADDRLASQLCNAFAFDDCNLSLAGIGGPLPCSEWGSHAWENPGEGVTVAPDDILNWNKPPNGVYGMNEPLVYMPGEWGRVYKWAKSSGTADVIVNVRIGGLTYQYVNVILYVGGFPPQKTDERGQVRFSSVPCGKYEVQADLDLSLPIFPRLTAKKLVDVPCSGEVTVDLDLIPYVPVVPKSLYRRVSFSGVLAIQDPDCCAAGVGRGTWPFSFSEELNPITEWTRSFHFAQTVEDIQGVLDLKVKLYEGEIQISGDVILNADGSEKGRRAFVFTQPFNYVKGSITGIQAQRTTWCVCPNPTDRVTVDLTDISNLPSR